MIHFQLKRFVFLFLLGMSVPVMGQVVQYGKVTEMNKEGKTMQGVSVHVPSASDSHPTASDAFGVFRLRFAEHQVGDVIHGLRIRKQGYEVVNNHIVREGWTLTDRDTLRVVMAPVGKIAEARAHYYDLIETACVSRYDSTLNFIEDQFAQGLITETERRYWLDEAERELAQTYLHIDDMADRFARVATCASTPDDLLIHELLSAGDFGGAMAMASDTERVTVLDAYQGVFRFPMENPERYMASSNYDTVLVNKMLRVMEILNDEQTDCGKRIEELRKLLR